MRKHPGTTGRQTIARQCAVSGPQSWRLRHALLSNHNEDARRSRFAVRPMKPWQRVSFYPREPSERAV